MWSCNKFKTYDIFIREHNKISPSTPSHFLHQVRDVDVLDLDNIEECNGNKRYAYRMKIKQYLRDKFGSEYLGALMHLKRNEIGPEELNVGNIVFIGRFGAKCIEWPLAHINELIVRKDGNVSIRA